MINRKCPSVVSRENAEKQESLFNVRSTIVATAWLMVTTTSFTWDGV